MVQDPSSPLLVRALAAGASPASAHALEHYGRSPDAAPHPSRTLFAFTLSSSGALTLTTGSDIVVAEKAAHVLRALAPMQA